MIVSGGLCRIGIVQPAFHIGQDFPDRAQAQPAMAVGQERRCNAVGGRLIEVGVGDQPVDEGLLSDSSSSLVTISIWRASGKLRQAFPNRDLCESFAAVSSPSSWSRFSLSRLNRASCGNLSRLQICRRRACRSGSARAQSCRLLPCSTAVGLPVSATARLRTSCQMRKRWASGCAHEQRKPSRSFLSVAGSSEHLPTGGCFSGR